jgi:hypothetical protein
MSDNEWIEMILLRSCGNTNDPLLERFDRETIAAVRLDLILNWLLTETTLFADDGRTLESRIICTPAGDVRLQQLESQGREAKENLERWVTSRNQESP